MTEPMTYSEATTEANRVMTVCNACRYCEGLCATFQSMTLYRSFRQHDLDHLANLCHNCTACFYDCQYAPPHEFGVNVPMAMSALRVQTYRRFAWPQAVGSAFHSNGLVLSVVTALTLVTVMLGLLSFSAPGVMFASHTGPGAFYAVMSHGVMVATGGLSFGFGLLAMMVSVRRFWRAGNAGKAPAILADVRNALKDAATLKYMDGGHGDGCTVEGDAPSNTRRYAHQLTMWGFLLCFASTSVATVYDYGFGLVAPYDFLSLPVLLGTAGGAGLVFGPAGLLWARWRTDRQLLTKSHAGLDVGFIVLLLAISVTGLLLLAFRATPAMGSLLAVHLGFVFAFFLVLPFSKFVHGFYRLAALVQFHRDRRTQGPT